MRLYFLIARRRHDALSPIAMATIDVIDVLFVIPAAVYGSGYLWLAAAVQYIARRWSVSARGFLLTWGLQPTAFWCQVFPGAARLLDDDIMSNDHEPLARTSSEPDEPDPVRSDCDAECTSSDNENEPGDEPTWRNLSRLELITLLAVRRDANGRYQHSGNDIVSFVGGTRADVLDVIAQVRGTKKEPQPRTMGHSARPQKGW
jgi:hypothetical protein